MINTCPECGALVTAELSCQSVFDECLAKEFANAGFGAVHHLTVAAYMLQHSSKLSRDGWLSMRQLLREFLVENKPPAEVRRKNKSVVDNSRRTWKITSRDGLAIIDNLPWTKTILDVRLDIAENYCADISEWARAVLANAEQVEPV